MSSEEADAPASITKDEKLCDNSTKVTFIEVHSQREDSLLSAREKPLGQLLLSLQERIDIAKVVYKRSNQGISQSYAGQFTTGGSTSVRNPPRVIVPVIPPNNGKHQPIFLAAKTATVARTAGGSGHQWNPQRICAAARATTGEKKSLRERVVG